MGPNFKLYVKAVVINTVWYLYKNRYIDHLKRIESPEINPCIYGQVIEYKGAKNIHRGKDTFLNGSGNTRWPHVKE